MGDNVQEKRGRVEPLTRAGRFVPGIDLLTTSLHSEGTKKTFFSPLFSPLGLVFFFLCSLSVRAAVY